MCIRDRYFICTESPEINVERVRNRVAKGGHPVPEAKIVSRYYNSLSLLREAINHTHRTYLFDNTGREGKLIAEIYKGKTFTLKNNGVPSWVNKYVLEASN